MRIGLGAGTLALLAQILLWAWMPTAVAADGGVFGGILVCTPNGFKTVSLDGALDVTGKAGGGDAPALVRDACPLCPLIGGLALPPPDLFALAQGADAVDRGAGLEPRRPSGWFLYNLQARAPPMFG